MINLVNTFVSILSSVNFPSLDLMLLKLTDEISYFAQLSTVNCQLSNFATAETRATNQILSLSLSLN